jgi:hypothetical protein
LAARPGWSGAGTPLLALLSSLPIGSAATAGSRIPLTPAFQRLAFIIGVAILLLRFFQPIGSETKIERGNRVRHGGVEVTISGLKVNFRGNWQQEASRVANPSIRSIQKDGNCQRLNRDPDSWFVKIYRKLSFVNKAGEFPNTDKSLNLPSLPISTELRSVKIDAPLRQSQAHGAAKEICCYLMQLI